MRYRELHGDEISRKRAERYRANPEPARKRAREYHRRHASAKRAARYGLSLADLEGLYAAQGGCCAACGASVEWLGRSSHVDHCHERGVVRGILCHNCNTALGLLRDSRERLAALDAYLERTA